MQSVNLLQVKLEAVNTILVYFMITCSWVHTLHTNPNWPQLRYNWFFTGNQVITKSRSLTVITKFCNLISNESGEVRVSRELSSLAPSVFSIAPFQKYRELKVAVIILLLLSLLKLRRTWCQLQAQQGAFKRSDFFKLQKYALYKEQQTFNVNVL